MNQLANHDILYAGDFEPQLLGPITFQGQTFKFKSDFYDVDNQVKKHLDDINLLLKKMLDSDDVKLSIFMSSMSSLQDEIANLVLKNFPDISKLHVTNKHGRGIEVGIKAQLKPEFQKSKKIAP